METIRKFKGKWVIPLGLEPRTHALEGRCSNPTELRNQTYRAKYGFAGANIPISCVCRKHRPINHTICGHLLCRVGLFESLLCAHQHKTAADKIVCRPLWLVSSFFYRFTAQRCPQCQPACARRSLPARHATQVRPEIPKARAHKRCLLLAQWHSPPHCRPHRAFRRE